MEIAASQEGPVLHTEATPLHLSLRQQSVDSCRLWPCLTYLFTYFFSRFHSEHGPLKIELFLPAMLSAEQLTSLEMSRENA